MVLLQANPSTSKTNANQHDNLRCAVFVETVPYGCPVFAETTSLGFKPAGVPSLRRQRPCRLTLQMWCLDTLTVWLCCLCRDNVSAVCPCGCVICMQMTSLWMCHLCGDNVSVDVPSLRFFVADMPPLRFDLADVTSLRRQCPCRCAVPVRAVPPFLLLPNNLSFYFINCARLWQVCPLFPRVTSSSVSGESDGNVFLLWSCCPCGSMLLSLRSRLGVSAVQSWCQSHTLFWS
jgi:hypothetical protein